MNQWLIASLIFLVAYTINLFFISIVYHRSLAHGGIVLHPLLRKFALTAGVWIVGIDPVAWSCMHRLHHKYSDTARDPHSPTQHNAPGLLLAQLRSYEKIIRRLMINDPKYVEVIADLETPVHFLYRKGLWFLPYTIHAAIALTLGFLTMSPVIALGYFLGMMSHPVQGWMVNYFGHHSGYRNFDLDDKSTNCTLVGWFVFGEGYQNNHHRFPDSAKFSVKWFEVDPGYGLAQVLKVVGLVRIPQDEVKSYPVAS